MRLVRQVRLKCVKFRELGEREVSLDLLLIHHSVGQRLLRHLPIIDFLLHCALRVNIHTTKDALR